MAKTENCDMYLEYHIIAMKNRSIFCPGDRITY